MSTPKLRFPEFTDDWCQLKIKDVLQKVARPVAVVANEQYRQIGIRSHGKGVFHKDAVSGVSLGGKRVFWVEEGMFVVNIVFAWEQAVAITTSLEKGMIASHRFPMFKPKEKFATAKFIHRLFLTAKGKHLLGLASPGGAGRNKTLGQKEFDELEVTLPSAAEQTKISNFLATVDEKIEQLGQKCELLTQYKKGVMQQIFSQSLRFMDDDGQDFPEWEPVELKELASKVKSKNKGALLKNVLTNSATQGIISQSEYFERDIANQNNLDGYYVVDTDDFVYNPRVSSFAPVGPIKRNKNAKGVMSPLYTVFRFNCGNLDFLELYFETNCWHDYMKSVANSGARHDRMNITSDDFFALPILMPSEPEQQKIAAFLSALEGKITNAKAQLEVAKQYKQGLLQQMFV